MKTIPTKIQNEIDSNDKKIAISEVNPLIASSVVSKKNLIKKVENGHLIFTNEENEVFSSDFGFGSVAKISSDRLITFKKSNKCICCGLEGSYYKKTYNYTGKSLSFHLNLYTEVGDKEVLFTKDHITPKSKGGKDNLENYATCCTECNMLKSNSELDWDDLRFKFLTDKITLNKKSKKGDYMRFNVQKRLLKNSVETD